MARIPALSDGQPLTYELINKIIEKLGSIKDPIEDQSQNIEVYGPNINRTSRGRAKIVSGVASRSLKTSAVEEIFTIEYNQGKAGTLFTKPPIVVATLVDSEKGADPDMATLTIIEQNQKNFKVKVRVLKSKKKNVPIIINYIAIGAGPNITG